MARIENDKTLPHAERILTTIESGAAAAKSMVVASWARSVNVHGLAPDLSPSVQRWSESDLSERRDRMSRMLHVSQPTVERLLGMVSLAGCAVFLCDKDGVILESHSTSNDRDHFEKVGLGRGADWSEGAQGTNGIGTCIAEGRAVSIHQDQHFIASNTPLHCMGAPIFDNEGNLAAVIDISACRSDLNGAMSTLISQAVNDAAGQIEADNFCDVYSGMRILKGNSDNRRAPVLLAVNSDDLVIGATRAARKLYGLPTKEAFTPKPTADLLGEQEVRGIGLDNAERREINRAIARAKGNMSEAARLLGVSRATFYRRAKKLGLLNG